MKYSSTKSPRRHARVLGVEAFAAISAVEGLRLSTASKKRVDALLSSKLTPAQRRAAVVKAYKGKAGT